MIKHLTHVVEISTHVIKLEYKRIPISDFSSDAKRHSFMQHLFIGLAACWHVGGVTVYYEMELQIVVLTPSRLNTCPFVIIASVDSIIPFASSTLFCEIQTEGINFVQFILTFYHNNFVTDDPKADNN